MRIPEDIDWVMELLAESKRTGRPIESRVDCVGSWAVTKAPLFLNGKGNYRVQPAPPQPKLRPMNAAELEQEACRGTIVKGQTRQGTYVVGPLVMWSGMVTICGWDPDSATLTYGNPDHPRYGQPLQVEIKDAPQ